MHGKYKQFSLGTNPVDDPACNFLVFGQICMNLNVILDDDQNKN
jgi:hypothetical protein